jgi:hypothetical protein
LASLLTALLFYCINYMTRILIKYSTQNEPYHKSLQVKVPEKQCVYFVIANSKECFVITRSCKTILQLYWTCYSVKLQEKRGLWIMQRCFTGNRIQCMYHILLAYYSAISNDVTTKSTQCVCDQHGSRPACASAK